jgi:hypothetical protein
MLIARADSEGENSEIAEGLPRDEALEVVRCWIWDTIGEELWG